MNSPAEKDALAVFDPLAARWFEETIGAPSPAQEAAWPVIGRGEHTLVCAPTGGGKTLTAFFHAIERLMTGRWETGRTRVLYVSPLKALNNDIRRNLLEPLESLRKIFSENDRPPPEIRVMTRSGDTDASERRAMVRRPPEILITTPESLNLILSSRKAREILADLKLVILDEIHAVAGSKRGTHLITAIERLTLLSGEFQRVALSATLRRPEKIAEWIGGSIWKGSSASPEPRTVRVVQARGHKKYSLRVMVPEKQEGPAPPSEFWSEVGRMCREIAERNRSTLFFVNNRTTCEKLTRFINGEGEERLAYSHHGSLSRPLREEVERALKQGRLKAIVATGSLELGIDIGDLDEVVLIESVDTIASAVQRIGRAGHRLGAISRGTAIPLFDERIAEAAPLIQAVLAQDIDELRIIENPLDALAQVLISMTAMEPWRLDDLYSFIRTIHPYRRLPREHFDLTIAMLEGKFGKSPVRELRARLMVDRTDQTVAAKKSALMDLYLSGGTIPDRGYYRLIREDTGARLGDLDEEFVWEARIGNVFFLGTRNWRVERITSAEVFVRPASRTAPAPPFWKADLMGRGFHFSERIAEFMERADAEIERPEDFRRWLAEERFFSETAAERLIDLLQSQREHTGAGLPHRRRILLEWTRSITGENSGSQLIIHNFWGGRVNRAYAIALSAGWKNRFGYQPEISVSNDRLGILIPDPVPAAEILALVRSDRAREMVRDGLTGSGIFAAMFRECAGRALLITRSRAGERTPLWLNRLRSKKIMDAVSEYRDFPIMIEAARACLRDELDVENLERLLAEIETGRIAWEKTQTNRASPFARLSGWRQTNEFLYEVDRAPSGGGGSIREDLVDALVHDSDLRPVIAAETAETFSLKRRRLYSGYAPSDGRDLVAWIVERGVIPEEEWNRLIDTIREEAGDDFQEIAERLSDRAFRARRDRSAPWLIAPVENGRATLEALWGDLSGVEFADPLEERPITAPPAADAEEGLENDRPVSDVLLDWLRFYGPIEERWIARSLALTEASLKAALAGPLEDRRLIRGRLIEKTKSGQICEAENFATLLRITRAENRANLEPLPITALPRLVAEIQGFADLRHAEPSLDETLERLIGYEAPVDLWESEILPARRQLYQPGELDELLRRDDFIWKGAPGQKISFRFREDWDLFEPFDLSDVDEDAANENEEETLLPDRRGKYDFETLREHLNLTPAELTDRLWDEVWRGRLVNDDFEALCRGAMNRFTLPENATVERTRRRPGRRGPRARRSSTGRRSSGAFYPGAWARPPVINGRPDRIEADEILRERVRILIDRHGVVFREILEREPAGFNWRDLFRSIRLMELSGELIAGQFFTAIPGPQFTNPAILETLNRLRLEINGENEKNSPEDPTSANVFWLNAADPASPCGMPFDELRAALPPRHRSHHIAWLDGRIALVSEARGRRLRFMIPPDDPRLRSTLAPLIHSLSRPFQPWNKITTETINDHPASTSPYLPALREVFEADNDGQAVHLFRRLRPPTPDALQR